jgi:hypothetical protein
MESRPHVNGVRYLGVMLVAAGFLLPAELEHSRASTARRSSRRARASNARVPAPPIATTASSARTTCATRASATRPIALISLAHADTCGDVTKINEAFDIDDFGGDNVRTPPAGNLPISGVFGNAVCCAGPTLPCFVGPAGLAFAVRPPRPAAAC